MRLSFLRLSLGCAVAALSLMFSPALPAQGAAAGTAPAPPAHREHAPAVRSLTLTVRSGGKEVVLSLADLGALPQTSVTVTNAHTGQEETYTGPLVSEVLAKAGVVLSPSTQGAVLRSYVMAEGTDGYFVVYSGAELQSALHRGESIVAVAQAGQPLASQGAFQLIDSLDAKPARWVRNLNRLEVIPVNASAGTAR